MVRVSASKAGLLPHCQFAFRENTPWEYTSSRAAEQGNLFHSAIAAVVDPDIASFGLKGGKWLLDRMAQATRWLDAQEFPAPPQAEVAYAYNPAKGDSRVLGKNIGRKYREAGKADFEIAGSADFVVVEPEQVTVYDWKTGRAVTESVWPQMEMLGLMAARAHRVDRVILRPLHVTDYGVEDSMVRVLDHADLDRLEAEVRKDVAAIPDSWPEPGPHCDESWCPARKSCVAYQDMKRKAG